MKSFISTILMILLAVTASPALAQESTSPVSRIVIAPALSDVARSIKAELNAKRAAGIEGAQETYFFYGGRAFEPLWLRSPSAGWGINDAGRSLFDTFDRAAELGLDPADYAIPEPTVSAPEEAAILDLAITAAAVDFADDNYGGRLDPRSLSSNLDMPRPRLPRAEIFALLSDENPSQLLQDLAPDDSEFQALLGLLREHKERTEPVQIAEGPSIKPGMEDARVPKLRERLALRALNDATSIYDAALVAAVEAFQVERGLVPDGIVGNATRLALNRGDGVTRMQLLVNIEKWRWLPRDRGAYRVEVNIPEYRLRVRREGETVHETKVVVGTPQNQTPIFYDQIRHVVVNPYWNVPTSIARNEIAPQVIRDPGYLVRRQYELLANGKPVDPWSVDWSRVDPARFPFAIRQQPGTQNALGQVKFLFPNKHDVYLHDTPEKALFGRDVRAYSHGCVRVENPFDFAEALLAEEPAFGRDRLVSAFGPKERWFNMEVKVPVFLTYFTVRVRADGKPVSYADIYGHDQMIGAALQDSLL